LKRIEEELQSPVPTPETAEEEQRAREDRIALLSSRLQEIDAQREEVRSRLERLSASNDSLESAKESYSIAIGRLPSSPHPYTGRKLADEALQANREVLDKAEQVLEKADALHESATSSLQGLAKLPPSE
jgi:hypothetical protein